jgi:hypothetical protein
LSASEPSRRPVSEAYLESIDARVRRLEAEDKTWIKRLTNDAGVVALLLGLILTIASLWDTFVARPRADRIQAIARFNAAVNSMAKQQETIVRLQTEENPALFAAVSAAITPQILNDLSTSRAILRELKDEDVGIPQLVVLTQEAANWGDLTLAGEFIARALKQTDVTPYLRSEALRNSGRVLAMKGQVDDARKAYDAALLALGGDWKLEGFRAYVLMDRALMEYSLGDCKAFSEQTSKLEELVRAPTITLSQRLQLAATLGSYVVLQQGHCSPPTGLANLLSGGQTSAATSAP